MLLLLEGGIVEASHPELCRVDDGQPATIVFDGITQPALKSIDSEQSDRAGTPRRRDASLGPFGQRWGDGGRALIEGDGAFPFSIVEQRATLAELVSKRI